MNLLPTPGPANTPATGTNPSPVAPSKETVITPIPSNKPETLVVTPIPPTGNNPTPKPETVVTPNPIPSHFVLEQINEIGDEDQETKNLLVLLFLYLVSI